MTCDRCNDLCITYPIRTPGELKKAIVVAADNLKDGTLEELPTHAPIFEPSVPFASVVAGTARPDFLAYRFRCKNCGEVFSLAAETYHGSGGSWHPEREVLLVKSSNYVRNISLVGLGSWLMQRALTSHSGPARKAAQAGEFRRS